VLELLEREKYQKMLESGNIELTDKQLACLGAFLFNSTRAWRQFAERSELIGLRLITFTLIGSEEELALTVTRKGKSVLIESGLVRVVNALLDFDYKPEALGYIRKILPERGMLTEFLVHEDPDVSDAAKSVLDFVSWVEDASSEFWKKYRMKWLSV